MFCLDNTTSKKLKFNNAILPVGIAINDYTVL